MIELLGQTDAVAALSATQVGSVWDLLVKGGPIMIPIGLVSLIALAVGAERSVTLRRRSVVPSGFLAGVDALRHDARRAIDFCRQSPSPIANLVLAALKAQGERREVIERAVEEAGQRERMRFRRFMRLMSALPQMATMLGLLGTIFGMIKTFQAVAASGQALGKTEMLAKGIFEAWTATAAGLLVAIPVLAVYQLLMGRIDAAMVELDTAVSEWMERDRSSASAVKSAEAPASLVEAVAAPQPEPPAVAA